jgi:DeoR/GlpR family transcriptional regulator of sugar metabolism
MTMLVPERHRRILEHVRRHGSARIDELAEQFAISAWTVRRDLQHLEHEGLLRRTHGGALVRVDPRADQNDGSLATTGDDGPGQHPAKARIGRHAAALIPEHATVLVLAGTTTAAMLPHLAERQLTVVTNGLEIAYALRHSPSVSVMMLGGMLHRAQMTLLGPQTEAAMADLHVDLIVAGAYGIDPDVGVTGAKIAQAGHHRAMLSHTDALIVLADSTKLGRRGPTVFAGVDQVDRLVTDTDADPGDVARVRARGAVVDLV